MNKRDGYLLLPTLRSALCLAALSGRFANAGDARTSQRDPVALPIRSRRYCSAKTLGAFQLRPDVIFGQNAVRCIPRSPLWGIGCR